jgi:hypothetical protein
MPKLNQILAIEKNVKNKRENEFTSLYQSVQKPELLTGFSRTYAPRKDGDEMFPAENKVVQIKADDALKKFRQGYAELFNITGTKDRTNCEAKADVVVDGKVLLAQVPATHLLFIEKRLVDLINFIAKIPTLPQDEVWRRDDGVGLYRTEPTESLKTKKLEEWKVIVPSTPQHPAQTQKMTEDVVVGTWKTVKYSGALRAEQRDELLAKAEKLQKAVKFAREEANQTAVTELPSGDAVLTYIFG